MNVSDGELVTLIGSVIGGVMVMAVAILKTLSKLKIPRILNGTGDDFEKDSSYGNRMLAKLDRLIFVNEKSHDILRDISTSRAVDEERHKNIKEQLNRIENTIDRDRD